ncbi:MAG: hypothetical protein E6238_06725 [Streptococcus sp.]|jgi:putative membrane protein|uniref:hypothetical protein n=1 Tax=Streptococcus TaxID=1301 RepID=UPI001D093C90|nr:MULTISPECIES: hypothetical protein [Streptococcus]MCB7107627.1 hypothetical protein [Streptococcus oralis]MCQ5169762.1 hypothetical protein [Streptococcus oralis]MDU5072586.1 hypothetical protein [Streptococcus sp.]
MENARIINRWILPRINQVSKDNSQRDCLSLSYIIISILGMVSFIHIVIKGVDTFQNRLGILNFDFYLGFIAFSLTIGAYCLYNVLMIRKTFILEIFALVILSIIWLFLYDLKFLFLSLTSVLLPMFLLYPIGELSYYKLIQNLNYLEEVMYNYFLENSAKKINKIKLSTVICISVLFFNYSISKYISLNSWLSTLLILSLILLMWLYQYNSSKEIQLFKKFLIYFVFLIVLLVANFQMESNLLKLPLLLLNILLAMERIVSLSKEAKELIISKSILYYIDHEDIEERVLLSEVISINYIKSVVLSEEEIVRQLLIRFRLKLKEDFLNIYSYRKKDFKRYKQLVESYKYFMEFDESWLNNMDDLYKKVKEIVEIPDQEIVIPQIYIEYAVILFYSNKYKESIDVFRRVFIYLDIKDLEMLRQAYVELGDTKNAEIIQKIIIKEKQHDRTLLSP